MLLPRSIPFLGASGKILGRKIFRKVLLVIGAPHLGRVAHQGSEIIDYESH